MATRATSPSSPRSSTSHWSTRSAWAWVKAEPCRPWSRNSALRCSLNGVVAHLARAHTDHGIDRRDPHLAVADLAGTGGSHDRVGHPLGLVVTDQDLERDLRDELHGVLGAPVHLGVAALTTEATHLRDRHTGQADLGERRLHVVELEGLDDRRHQLHDRPPVVSGPLGGGGGGGLGGLGGLVLVGAGSRPTKAGCGPDGYPPPTGADACPVVLVDSTKSG